MGRDISVSFSGALNLNSVLNSNHYSERCRASTKLNRCKVSGQPLLGSFVAKERNARSFVAKERNDLIGYSINTLYDETLGAYGI